MRHGTYDKKLGTFISPDPLIPDAGNVFAYNRYMYTLGNPLKYTDPTGHQSYCPVCDSWVRQIVWQTVWEGFSDAGLTNPMAPYYMVPVAMGVRQQAIEAQGGSSAEPALAMTADWYFENGEQTRILGADNKITQALMNDEGVALAHQTFIDREYQDMLIADNSRHEYKFGLPAARRELVDVARDGDWSTSFLGGYYVEVYNIVETDNSVLAEFNVHNRTGWSSATRVWSFSFKQDEKRPEPGPGGNLNQEYRWLEWLPK